MKYHWLLGGKSWFFTAILKCHFWIQSQYCITSCASFRVPVSEFSMRTFVVHALTSIQPGMMPPTARFLISSAWVVLPLITSMSAPCREPLYPVWYINTDLVVLIFVVQKDNQIAWPWLSNAHANLNSFYDNIVSNLVRSFGTDTGICLTCWADKCIIG